MFEKGDRVRCVGLESTHNQQYNGMFGTVISYSFGSVQAKLDNGEVVKFAEYRFEKVENEMQIEVGKSYCNASGKKITMVADRDKNEQKIKHLLRFIAFNETNGEYSLFDIDGKVGVLNEEFDLVSEWREPIEVKGYVAVYADESFGRIQKNRTEAKNTYPGAIAYVEVYGKEVL